MKIFEQADKTNEKVTYSWILDGSPKEFKCFAHNYKGYLELMDFKHIRGTKRDRGVYVTNNFESVKHISETWAIPVITNGTHAIHKVEMYAKRSISACP
jgi:hypothetical protein